MEITVPTNALSEIASSTSTIIGDMGSILALVLGILLAFFIMEAIMDMLRTEPKEYYTADGRRYTATFRNDKQQARYEEP